MRLSVVGPLECSVGERTIAVTGHLNRALLEVLAVDPSRVTGIDELVEAMWRGRPPAAAEKVVRNRVSLLRAALAPAFIETVGTGYRLGSAVVVDAARLEDARLSIAERLALWRGAPFAEIAEWPPARATSVRLGELRAHLEEVRVAELLSAGADPSSLIGTVEQLVDSDPFRERRWALLMRALYLAGRQRDALRAFERARVLLRDELGLNPGAELLTVERSILDQDLALGPAPARAPTATRRHTAIIGRTDELEAVGALLQEQRLVTLVGLGGIGKTALAHELARSRCGPSHLVDLGPVPGTADAVAEAVAGGLGIAAGPDARGAIATWSSTAPPCLVVVDNCEHVRDAVVAVLDVVLAAGAAATILATSRIRLGHRDEAVLHLGPLARPAAVALFRARAQRGRGAADEAGGIDQLCDVLSDVPLAIELAAARSSILSPADMVQDLSVVTAAPSRPASGPRWRDAAARDVVDVVAWAAGALSGDAALLYRRCATFPGGFTIGAARSMAEGDLDGAAVTEAFTELAEASLIEVRFGAQTRYHYLELVRARATRLLDEAGERERCQRRLVRWAADLADGLTCADVPRALAELSNLAAAARLACLHADVDAALRITGATAVLLLAERAELLDSKLAAVQLPGAPDHPRYARSCAELAFALFVLRGDVDGARHHADLVLAAEPGGRSAGWAHFTLGHLDGDLEHARRGLELARHWSDPLLQLYASTMLVDNAGRGGAPEAWELVRGCERVAARIDEPWARIVATIVRGVAHCQLDPEAALVHLERAAEMAERCGLTAFSTTARALAGLAGESEDPEVQLEMARHGLVDADRAGVSYLTMLALARVARALTEMGRPDRAALFAGAARARFSSSSNGTRLYQIDREDHPDHVARFDLGTTMEVGELLKLLDEWRARPREVGRGPSSSRPRTARGRNGDEAPHGGSGDERPGSMGVASAEA